MSNAVPDRPSTTAALRRAVFPGSFNPLTVAHLEVARRAMEAHDLDEVHLAVSTVALDKPEPPGPDFDERITLLEADAAEIPWLSVTTTNAQLIVDIARGYDLVIMGADKWLQVNDEAYYADAAARDEAIAALPTVVVAQRSGIGIDGATVLETPEELHVVSSTAARAGDRDLMAPQARAHWHEPPIIRRCELAEVEIASAIYLASRHAAVPAIPPSIHPDHDVHRWFREVLMPSTDVYLAEVDGTPVAMMALTPGWVEQLYVLPGHTGRRLGSSLLARAKAEQDELELWVFQSNTGALRFYERHGFVEVDRTDGDNEERAPDVRYRWTRADSTPD